MGQHSECAFHYQRENQGDFKSETQGQVHTEEFSLISASPYLGTVCLGRDSSKGGDGLLGTCPPLSVSLIVTNLLVFNSQKLSFLH